MLSQGVNVINRPIDSKEPLHLQLLWLGLKIGQ